MPRKHEYQWLLLPPAILLILLLITHFTGINLGLFLLLNKTGSLFPEFFWEHITYMGDALVIYVLMTPFVLRFPSIVWASFIALPIAGFVTRGMKYMIDAPRPPGLLDTGSFHLIGPGFDTSSFPSGHTLTAFAFAAIIGFQFPRKERLYILIGIAGLIGLSRIMVGVHWPVDLMAGAVGGWLCGWLAVVISRHWTWGMTQSGQITLLTVLLIASITLYSHNSGYPQVQLTQILFATTGVIYSLRHLQALGVLSWVNRTIEKKGKWLAQNITAQASQRSS